MILSYFIIYIYIFLMSTCLPAEHGYDKSRFYVIQFWCRTGNRVVLLTGVGVGRNGTHSAISCPQPDAIHPNKGLGWYSGTSEELCWHCKEQQRQENMELEEKCASQEEQAAWATLQRQIL